MQPRPGSEGAVFRQFSQRRWYLYRVLALALAALTLTVPLTGLQAGAGKESEAVWRAFARHVNGTPLLRGHTPEVLVLDDAYDPARSRDNAEQLARQGMAVMTGTAGIPNVRAMTPVLEKHRIALVGPGSGSLALRGQSAAVFHVIGLVRRRGRPHGAALRHHGPEEGKVAVIVDDVADRKALLEPASSKSCIS